MKSKEEKELEFLRSQTDSKLLDKSGYTSPLDEDVMRVKGGTPNLSDPATKIRNTTQHIDTKGIQKIGNAADVMKANAEKAARMKALRKMGRPTLGGLAGVAAALGSSFLPDSAMASEPVQAATRALDEGDPMSMLMPSDVGPEVDSFDDRLEKGTLTPEELEIIKQQYSQR